MAPTASEIKKPVRLNKNILNLIFFITGILFTAVMLTYRKHEFRFGIPGTMIVVSSCFAVLYLFLLQYYREVLQIIRKTLLILSGVLVLIAITRIVTDLPGNNLILLVPFAIIPVMIRTFYDSRLALFILLITILLAGFMVARPFEFAFMNFVSGMAAILTLSNIYKRSRLFYTSITVFISYTLIYMGISLMLRRKIPDTFSMDLLYFAGNGLLVLLSYPLIMILEQRFLFLSDATLLELSDTNQPLLRKLSDEAPGSFQHSLQVANLAEEAARITGANILLVRAGALYHDIGKIANPKFFVENQIEESSPHVNMDPKESSKVIINHVKNGVVLAKNYKIPIQIIDFIRTHHGTTVAYFFYKKFIDENPGAINIEREFSYPGPKPFSKETAIVMMADAVEASSRSLAKYTEENISELVERILYMQEMDGQYSDVPLTFKDISDIKDVFKKRLSNIYHVRIAYPERI